MNSRGNRCDDSVPPLQWGDVVEQALQGDRVEGEGCCHSNSGSKWAHLNDKCEHRVVAGGEDDPLLSQNGRYHFQHIFWTETEEWVVETDVQLR